MPVTREQFMAMSPEEQAALLELRRRGEVEAAPTVDVVLQSQAAKMGPTEEEIRAKAERAKDVFYEGKTPAQAFGETGRELVKGAARGATSGLSDPALQMAEGAWDAATDKKELLAAYLQRRREERARTALARGAHPGAVQGAETIGAAASTLMPGMGALSPGKGGMLRGAAKAGAMGVVGGAGMSEGDAFTPEGREKMLSDAMEAGALSVPLGAAAGKAGSIARKSLPKDLARKAESWTTTALTGQNSGDFKKMLQAEKVDIEGAGDLPARLLRDTSIGKSPVKWFGRSRDIYDEALRQKEALGGKISGVAEIIDNVRQDAGGVIDGNELARSIMAYERQIPRLDVNKTRIGWLRRQAASVRGRGITFKEAQDIKNSYPWNEAAEAATKNTTQKDMNRVKMAVGGKMDQAAEETAPMIGNSRRAERTEVENYPRYKQDFGTMADAERISKTKAARENVNRKVSLTSYLMGLGAGVGGSAATGSVWPTVAGLGVAAAHQTALNRGPSTMARGYDLASRAAATIIKKLGPKGEQMVQLAKRSNMPLAVAHAIMYKNDPDYRQAADAVDFSEEIKNQGAK